MVGLAWAGLVVFGGTLSAYAACSNPSPLPSGYAAPCPVFSVSPSLVAQTGTLTLSATPQAGTDYIYTTAYYAQGSTWLPVTLIGNNAAPSYSSGLANGSLPSSILSTLTPGTNYVVLWDWLWDPTAGCYKGPGLNQCNTGTWRLQTFGLTAGSASCTNLALNRPVTVSSVFDSTMLASNAVDGDLSTRWAALDTGPQWIYVDLQASYSISRAVLTWAAYPSAYQIQVSGDAVTWTAVYSTTTGMGGTENITFPAITARYVRMNGIQLATQWGDSLYEFQVYGSSCASPSPTPTPTPTPTPSPTPVAGNCITGNWTVGNQPPVGCRPYPSSLWNKPLPNAGSGGPMNHLAPNSDAIMQNAGTGCVGCGNLMPGHTYVAPPGIQDGTATPMYYGRASDPIYKVDACSSPSASDPPHNPTGTFWHIPNQAHFSGIGDGDQFFTVWDETSNLIFGAYRYGAGGGGILPNCAATTTGAACSMGSMGYCAKANYTTDKGYQVGNGGADSLTNGPQGLTIRSAEWIAGTINHALYINVSCEGGTAGQSVFPATPGHTAAQCADPAGPKPIHGSLIFLDYTDAQDGPPGLAESHRLSHDALWRVCWRYQRQCSRRT